MQRFWNLVIHPLLERVRPRRIIEVGSAGGVHTKRLLDYCAQQRGRCELHSIDPLPRYDVDALRQGREAIFYPHRCTSLTALPQIPPADVVLLDGDHNWYTAYNELKLICKQAVDAKVSLPIIICHDVGWPYGRRDLYYDPSTIPEQARQPHARGGLLPGQSAPSSGKGLNAHLYHAISEGGPHNGVLTAIEEFLAENDEEIELVVLPVLYGLGLLLPVDRTRQCPSLRDLIESFATAGGLRGLVDLAETHRIQSDTSAQLLRQRLDHYQAAAASMPSELDDYACGLPSPVLGSIQEGVLRTIYKGVRFWKSPFDVVIYMQLIQRLKPGTILEIGTLDGGSAVWFADQMEMACLLPNVISIDKLSQPKLQDRRIRFLEADALKLAEGLRYLDLNALPRPWLVVEDSAHTYDTTSAVLHFFDPLLQRGDYIVVEDGIVRNLPGRKYREYDDGPCRAVRDFLNGRSSTYKVDSSCCNFFGTNYTWNPGSFLFRV